MKDIGTDTHSVFLVWSTKYKSLDFISVLKEVKDKEKSMAIQDLAEAFNDVKLYEDGKKQLKSAKDLLDKLVILIDR